MAILIKTGPKIKGECIYVDNVGRIIIVKFFVGEESYFIINIYAPNTVNERKNFLWTSWR